MGIEDDQRRLAETVFAVTGQRLPADDPLVVAALFYADTLRHASADAAQSILATGQTAGAMLTEAVVSACDAAREAQTTMQTTAEAMMQAAAAERKEAATDRKALVTDIEKRVQQCLRQAAPRQSSDACTRWTATELVAAVAAGVVLLFCVEFVWFDFSLDWTRDVRAGRAFNRLVPTLAPDLRKRLIEHIEKHR